MYRQLRYVYGTANRLRSKFSDCSKNVKNYLFRTFMYSFYGSSIWSSYRQSTFHRLRVSYNNAYRILFNLRHRVSISSTLVQNNICTFQALIRKYVACFMIRCANSCNIWISSLVNSDDFLPASFINTFFSFMTVRLLPSYGFQASLQLCVCLLFMLCVCLLSLSYSSVIYAGLKLTLLKVNGSAK